MKAVNVRVRLMRIFLSKEYENSMTLMIGIVIGYVFNGFYLMVAGFIFYVKKTYYLSIITFLTAVINIPLCYYFFGLDCGGHHGGLQVAI